MDCAERLANFRLMVASVRAQTCAPLALLVGVSCSDDVVRAQLERTLADLQATLPFALVTTLIASRRRSQMENYKALLLDTPAVQALLQQHGQPWLLLSDDDDLWHAERAAAYMRVAAVPPRDGGGDSAVHAITCRAPSDDSSLASGNGAYVDIAVRAPLFCNFLRRVSLAVLDEPFCDLYWHRVCTPLAAVMPEGWVRGGGLYQWRRVDYPVARPPPEPGPIDVLVAAGTTGSGKTPGREQLRCFAAIRRDVLIYMARTPPARRDGEAGVAHARARLAALAQHNTVHYNWAAVWRIYFAIMAKSNEFPDIDDLCARPRK